ncbi:F-box/kelch-repeat protein SKIP11 [Brassica rapa]|uniref:F-box/kelch-repeat protein SKIP11 n=1 Tax=Brassica campestris TaxID=3711 RepID=UPI00142DCB55|nr:F-box/kelch-repeat protein SKIP11 [Brassica rapa]XP_009152230.2 F-box/kelch-repeat protein SKIP11 [Brassica rapa]XP_013664930.2 F-box/kelch-repeat protein SKIP11 [Brassica napus]XP_048637230.1 F-box/kelch-repeat protein SKIP11 [Brassica napus]
MLENRSPDSCLSSRLFSESTWSKSFMFPQDDDDNKLSNGNGNGKKRALEVVGEIRGTKSLKLMGFSITYDSDSSDYSEDGSIQEQEQGDSNTNGGDSSDSHSLINEIGRDNSIDCLIRCSRSDYGSIASLSRNFRSLVKSGDIYKLRRQNGYVEHWVYFSCQLLEWVAFDPVERRWMQLPTMPSSVTFMCADKESLAVGTDLLVLGKDDFSSHVIYRYSLLTNSWSSGMKMNSPRCLFGSASLGEIAIFAGGCDSQGKILDFAEMYNSELQTWVTLPRMNKPRKMCSGVFMDGKFYVIGGIGGADAKALTCGEEYDLEAKKWTEVPDLSPPRSRADQADARPAAEAPPLVAVVNNQLYAADHADMEVRKYDKEKKKWLTIGRLPERAGSVNGWGLAFRACGERLIVIGGPKYSGGGFIELNSWTPRDGDPPQWTLLDRKHSPNFVYNCAVMGC